MKDGSPLPDWIKVDPKTGATRTNIPDGVENVEIIIIATDSQNERREISVKIDPEQILKDKQILKRAKKQNANITVDESGNVNLIKNNRIFLQIEIFDKEFVKTSSFLEEQNFKLIEKGTFTHQDTVKDYFYINF